MSCFADGSPYSYGGASLFDYYKGQSIQRLNVGWLDGGMPFSQGPVPAELLNRLKLISQFPFREMYGVHTCNLPNCPDRKLSQQAGSGEIDIRSKDDIWYATPTLIAHYVEWHQYNPPEQFIAAVLEPGGDDNLTLLHNDDFESFDKDFHLFLKSFPKGTKPTQEDSKQFDALTRKYFYGK